MYLLINFQSLGIIFAIMFGVGAVLIFSALIILIVKVMLPNSTNQHLSEHQKAQLQIKHEKQRAKQSLASKRANQSNNVQSNSSASQSSNNKRTIMNYQRPDDY